MERSSSRRSDHLDYEGVRPYWVNALDGESILGVRLIANIPCQHPLCWQQRMFYLSLTKPASSHRVFLARPSSIPAKGDESHPNQCQDDEGRAPSSLAENDCLS